jgi:hypothetical protein
VLSSDPWTAAVRFAATALKALSSVAIGARSWGASAASFVFRSAVTCLASTLAAVVAMFPFRTARSIRLTSVAWPLAVIAVCMSPVWPARSTSEGRRLITESIT